MKLNKNKGKVHPSPSSSSSSSSSSTTDPISSLNLLLPAAILSLISVLSLQDREVLAYMITRSLKSSSSSNLSSTTCSSSILSDETQNNNQYRKSKKSSTHRFDCECFECYTTYWHRWDLSPHRELIHQAIEAFEDLQHLDKPCKKSTGKSNRRREKEKDKKLISLSSSPEKMDVPVVVPVPVPEVSSSPEKEEAGDDVEERGGGGHVEERERESVEKKQQWESGERHKGLARKMLPDVIGLFNSRLWNLWGPTV